MTFQEPVATFLADDATLEHALPGLAAFRLTNPDMRVLVIPRSVEISRLAGFAAMYRFDFLAADFRALDLLDAICIGPQARHAGRLRALAVFDIVAPAVIHVDAAARCGSLAALAAGLGETTASIIATASLDAGQSCPYPIVGVGGPRIGSTAVIDAVRENLVAFLIRDPGGEPLRALLDMASVWMRLKRVAIEPTTLLPICDARHSARIQPIEQITDRLTILDNGGNYVRISGRVINSPPGLAAQYEMEAGRVCVEPPPAIVAHLRNATVHRRGVVMTDSGCLVRQSLMNSDPGEISLLKCGAVAHRDVETPMVLLKQTWDDNYGHWLIESLPRVGLVAEVRDLAGCRFLVGDDGGTMGEVYRDSLGLLGIKPDQIIASSNETRFCAELIYPAPLTVQPWVKAPRVLTFLQRLARLVPVDDNAPRKLYVSRNDAGRRRLRNEATIIPDVVARGYVVVRPETLAFAAQVALFRGATHVVGNLGAALANLAFSPSGVRLLALTTEFMQDDFFWDLVSQRGGRYVSLHGKAVDPAAGMQSDFDVDRELLLALLDEFEDDGGLTDNGSR